MTGLVEPAAVKRTRVSARVPPEDGSDPYVFPDETAMSVRQGWPSDRNRRCLSSRCIRAIDHNDAIPEFPGCASA